LPTVRGRLVVNALDVDAIVVQEVIVQMLDNAQLRDCDPGALRVENREPEPCTA
jgi:hypothetical protein